MECIRLLHPRRYNERERRFTSFAFRNSDSDGTLSIIDWACIQATGRSVGEHIRHHYGKYQNVVWEPPIFWKFDTAAILPVGQIKPDNSGGDDCHRVVEGVADQTLAAIIVETFVLIFQSATMVAIAQSQRLKSLPRKRLLRNSTGDNRATKHDKRSHFV